MDSCFRRYKNHENKYFTNIKIQTFKVEKYNVCLFSWDSRHEGTSLSSKSNVEEGAIDFIYFCPSGEFVLNNSFTAQDIWNEQLLAAAKFLAFEYPLWLILLKLRQNLT